MAKVVEVADGIKVKLNPEQTIELIRVLTDNLLFRDKGGAVASLEFEDTNIPIRKLRIPEKENTLKCLFLGIDFSEEEKKEKELESIIRKLVSVIKPIKHGSEEEMMLSKITHHYSDKFHIVIDRIISEKLYPKRHKAKEKKSD